MPTSRKPRHASPLGERAGAFVNLSHRLRYVQAGYLASMDAELHDLTALPATRDLLSAFHPVVFQDVARRGGLAVPPLQIIEDEEDLRWPCRLVPAHGLMLGHRDARTERGAKRAWTSVSMGGGQPVIQYPLEGKAFTFRAFLGMTLASGREELAWDVWSIFHLPLVTVHGLQNDDAPVITHLEPLSLADLSERDLAFFSEVSERPYSGASWTA